MALIYYLTHIHLEFGARTLLGSECERVGIKKPQVSNDVLLVVCGQGRTCRRHIGNIGVE